ncbi:MAG: pyridoxamine 5'-phosphate oxidase family protein [Candidatus Acidiferrum sp.]
MNLSEVFQFMDGERLGVLATVSDQGSPEAALMGVVVTPELELIFDTLNTTRKYSNIKKNPRVAFVIGCSSEISVQYEGVAEELSGDDLAKYKRHYFAKFTDGPARENWPGMTYFVVRPRWLRFCDYNPGSRRIEEHTF